MITVLNKAIVTVRHTVTIGGIVIKLSRLAKVRLIQKLNGSLVDND